MSASKSLDQRRLPLKATGVQVYSTEYFLLCAAGGAFACGPTHSAMTPIDLVKCNTQTDSKHFGRGLIRGMSSILNGSVQDLGFKPGFRGLWRGFLPTFVGYSLQGAGKYGFYELFVHKYSLLVGKEFAEGPYKPVVWACASASAEFLADIALCPFEATKVRIQTNPKYANGLIDGMSKIIRTEGINSLYAGITPLWLRQIPYTVVKFVAFEGIANEIYAHLPKKKEDMSSIEQLGVVFTAGYAAGILCATSSHPADVLVSKINSVSSSGSFMSKAKLVISGDASKGFAGTGFKGLWVGLPARIFMIGTLTGAQWMLYGAFKHAFGLPTPGGH